LLSVSERLGELDLDGRPAERSEDRPEHAEVQRRAAREAVVLLRNDPVDGTPVLPLDRDALERVAVIGPNADVAAVLGGGSAAVNPHHVVTVLDGLRAALGDRVEVVHEPGVDATRTLPPIDRGASLGTSRSGRAAPIRAATSWLRLWPRSMPASTTRSASRPRRGTTSSTAPVSSCHDQLSAAAAPGRLAAAAPATLAAASAACRARCPRWSQRALVARVTSPSTSCEPPSKSATTSTRSGRTNSAATCAWNSRPTVYAAASAVWSWSSPVSGTNITRMSGVLHGADDASSRGVCQSPPGGGVASARRRA
jgi:hypothetical protein